LPEPQFYAIRAAPRDSPKSWAVEGSNDGAIWFELDHRTDRPGLTVTENRSFAIARTDAFSMIRLRQIGLNSAGTNTLVLAAFEIFSVLVRMSRPRPFVPKDTLDGIIAYLTRQASGNVHDRKVVVITAPKQAGTHFAPKNVANLQTDGIFCSTGRKKTDNIPRTRNNSLSFDFRNRRIIPAHYTIRSAVDGRACPKSWVVEVSADGKDWAPVDYRENTTERASARCSRSRKATCAATLGSSTLPGTTAATTCSAWVPLKSSGR
jgi:hypothetical protein